MYGREIKKPQTVNVWVGIMNASIVLLCLSLISNSLPTNEDICSSVIITWSVCYSACAKVLCFTNTNEHGRSTEANVMSSTAFCGRILSAQRKKDGESGTKTQNRQRFLWCWGYWIGYDAKTAKNSFRGIQSRIRSMSGVITMIKGITFPSFAWKKCFSPRKVLWRIEDTFFTGHCIVASRQSCGPAEKMTPRCE